MSLLMRSLFKIILLFLWIPLSAIGTRFLTVPVSAIELTSMNTPWKNPANPLQTGTRPVMGISYGSWLADSRTFSFQLSGESFGGLSGLKVRYLGIDDLELRTHRPSNAPLAYYSAYGASIEGFYSRSIHDIFRIGMGIKILNMQIYTSHANGAATDLGMTVKLNPGSSLGLSILNWGTMMNALGKTPPELPTSLVLSGKQNYRLRMITGSVQLMAERRSNLNSLVLSIDNHVSYKTLNLRCAILTSGKVVTFSTGIFLQMGIYRLGYSIQMGNQILGFPQLLDVSIQLPQ